MQKEKIFLTLLLVGVGLFFNSPAASAETKGIVFEFGEKKISVSGATIDSWKKTSTLPKYNALTLRPITQKLALLNYLNNKTDEPQAFMSYAYNPTAVYQDLKILAEQNNLPAQEPELIMENEKVIGFTPPQEGLEIDIRQTLYNALIGLENQNSAIPLAVIVAPTHLKLSETNNLGINGLIGRGESNFKGSPKNRIHNIKVGVEKFKGLIIKPNEIFSFNKFLGPVEKEQGFLPELVIKKEGTVPELGGGLCQVSSTTFRAAMNAGLPIKERKNHAYAVQYYSPQGTDATIYPGSVDLKFINDTQGYILIWPYIKDNNYLVFDFYGTKDSRKVVLSKPIQYDRKQDGSMKAEWTRVVEKNGVTSTSTFKSIYQSPALFHKEEKFITATGTTSSSAQAPKIN